MLDEFSSAKISQPVQKDPAPADVKDEASKAGESHGSGQSTQHAGETGDDEFSQQLQAGMAEMMRELESNPDMAKEFEQIMMGQFGMADNIKNEENAQNVQTPSSVTAKDSSRPQTANGQTSQPPGPPASFQDTIRQTMDRMKESNASASAASSTPAPGSDDFMTAMLNEIAQSQGGAEGNSEDAFSSMLLGMMEQLTNKDILYEPMKDLSGKFPDWLAEREPGQSKSGSITNEERTKYKEQLDLVQQIVGRFERPGYNDQNTEDREYIVERMQRMQGAGAPPADLVGDMGGAADMLVGLSDSETK